MYSISSTGERRAQTVNPMAVPTMHGGKEGMRVTHREFIQDIIQVPTTAGFYMNKFLLNPGCASTFPYLAGIAQNFTQYRLKGLAFFYRPLTTPSSSASVATFTIGSVIMATQYNGNLPAYSSKQQMESASGVTSCMPSESMLHLVECGKGIVGGDLKNIRLNNSTIASNNNDYDWGELHIALSNISYSAGSSRCGELWVSYDVELYGPTQVTAPSQGLIQRLVPKDYQKAYYVQTNPWVSNLVPRVTTLPSYGSGADNCSQQLDTIGVTLSHPDASDSRKVNLTFPNRTRGTFVVEWTWYGTTPPATAAIATDDCAYTTATGRSSGIVDTNAWFEGTDATDVTFVRVVANTFMKNKSGAYTRVMSHCVKISQLWDVTTNADVDDLVLPYDFGLGSMPIGTPYYPYTTGASSFFPCTLHIYQVPDAFTTKSANF